MPWKNPRLLRARVARYGPRAAILRPRAFERRSEDTSREVDDAAGLAGWRGVLNHLAGVRDGLLDDRLLELLLLELRDVLHIVQLQRAHGVLVGIGVGERLLVIAVVPQHVYVVVVDAVDVDILA